MHSLSSLAATATSLIFAACLVSAAPVLDILEGPTVLGGDTFKIIQVQNPGYTGFVTSGPAAMAKALSKYNVSLTSGLASAVYAAYANQDSASKGEH